MTKLDLQCQRFTLSNGATIEFEPAADSAYVSSEHAYMVTEIAPFTPEQYEVLAARLAEMAKLPISTQIDSDCAAYAQCLVAITKPQDIAETNIVA